MQTDKKTVRKADRQDDSQKGRQRKKGVGGGGEYSGKEETER